VDRIFFGYMRTATVYYTHRRAKYPSTKRRNHHIPHVDAGKDGLCTWPVSASIDARRSDTGVFARHRLAITASDEA
jgi:hypothetical protein